MYGIYYNINRPFRLNEPWLLINWRFHLAMILGVIINQNALILKISSKGGNTIRTCIFRPNFGRQNTGIRYLRNKHVSFDSWNGGSSIKAGFRIEEADCPFLGYKRVDRWI